MDLKAPSVFFICFLSFLSGPVKGPRECQGELQQLLKKLLLSSVRSKGAGKGRNVPFPNPQEQVNATNWGPCLDLSIKCHLIGKWANKIPLTRPRSTVRSFTGERASSCVSSAPGKFRGLLFFILLPAPSSGDIFQSGCRLP